MENTKYMPECILCSSKMYSPTEKVKDFDFSKYVCTDCKLSHVCPTLKIKTFNGYQCPECFKITK